MTNPKDMVEVTQMDKEAAQKFLDNVSWGCPVNERCILEDAFAAHRLTAQAQGKTDRIIMLERLVLDCAEGKASVKLNDDGSADFVLSSGEMLAVPTAQAQKEGG